MSETFSIEGKKLWITNVNGLVGQAVVRRLAIENCTLLKTTRLDLDLRDRVAVDHWIKATQPDVVIHTAAKVGGIEANRTQPVEFLYDNLMISTNIIQACAQYNVQKLLNLGSSCFYPKNSSQPIEESSLLTGSLELTNEAFALAKITSYKLAEYYRTQYGHDFITVVPANLYGPNDHFDIQRGHVIPALIKRFYEARINNQEQLTLWGSGLPEREFLYVDDAADGLLYVLKNYSSKELINLSGGNVITINELAELIKSITGYIGEVRWNTDKPDGMMKKVLSNKKIDQLGWQPNTELIDGLKKTYQYFLEQVVGN